MSAIAIEGLEARHLAQAHALSAAVGWPHRQEDWNFVLGLGQGLAALNGDELLGTIIWWPFGEKFATLGMVIVAPTMQGHVRGYRNLYNQHIEQAHRGCDFDFLRGADVETLPEGLFDGWIGGWWAFHEHSLSIGRTACGGVGELLRRACPRLRLPRLA